ncbi:MULTISPECIES: divalent-cation tolerance protein CutA [Dictyoglomus]|jgi:periplasmic divalent cation tolerance protein|uniref:CutA1 divalent ion tolerance protein n=1 Tax=Dictyoglomus turgidum (strain DSM 6724 / Z-1310) TaxID=515635 RepID=B8E308_DICTD|nr:MULTISPECIES: divalent-cation tolerance protein CutA [Dictyoglomus]ACK42508.1 CutA1 divalent ion tolerance protein [Dictyoglomus turgidum DSM 6724]PNV79930.1 MAG: divalent-cation tolerance protein CutA [Dictyoglomus turgidum]HBU32287.1 divalent-cation tolerance protein CutA [Dictyoglomus sp.]
MILTVVTINSLENAEKIANVLLDEKLCACVNIIPEAKSIYIWQGEKKVEMEVIMLIKTEKSKFSELVKRIRELHPYKLPEIIGIPINYGLPEYLEWIKSSLQ